MRSSLASGILFATPRTLDHDGWVTATRAAAAAVTLKDVEAAFVASLPSRGSICGPRSGRMHFERFKWGGVRRDDLRFVTFDLEQFQRAHVGRIDDAE